MSPRTGGAFFQYLFQSCRDPSCTVYFSLARNQRIYWFHSEVRVIQKQKQSKPGPFFPLKEQSTETKWCSTRNDITFGQQLPSWFEGWISFRLDFPSFFSPSFGSVRLCLHSLDRVYKYGKKGRQNKVSNFISSKNISSLSSGELTFPFKF